MQPNISTHYRSTDLLTHNSPSIGNIYFSDRFNHRIRKIAALTSTISTVAGCSDSTYTGDNIQATSSGLNQPIGVAVDASGE